MQERIYSFTRKNGRAENQDYLFYEKKKYNENESILTFGICDGMGGMEDGGTIAKLTAWTFCTYYSRAMANAFSKTGDLVPSDDMFGQLLSRAVNATQKTVTAYMEKNHVYGGSTLTVGVILSKMLYVINVGDSPCYVINGDRNSIELISDIENSAYEGLKKGIYTDKHSLQFRNASHRLTNFIGNQRFREPNVHSIPVFQNDLILMGSDGLFGTLGERDLFQIASGISTAKLLEQIADRSAQKGEHDNQSGIVCKIR